MRLFVSGPAVQGPGLDGWVRSVDILAGRRPWMDATFAPPAPSSLPPAERRRAGAAIRLAVAAAGEAVAGSGLDPAGLASVFGSSNGDGAVVVAILESLARTPRVVSPTQFHNSVHNAAAAYWAIGAACMAPSTSLGCYDDTFAAALLRAASQAQVERRPVLLCVYDAPLPEPLAAVRPTTASFAAAMVLSPARSPAALAEIAVRFVPTPPPTPDLPRAPGLHALYRANPAARCLRLLEALVGGEPARLAIGYLGDAHLEVDLSPC